MAYKSRLNILLGVHQFFPDYRTGTEVLTLELARGLRARGHFVQILSGAVESRISEKASPWLTQDEYDGFIVHRLHYGVANPRDPVTLHLFAPYRIRLVKDLVSRLNPDIVHFNHIIGFSGQVIPEIRGMGIPVIFSPTDFWVVCPSAKLFRTYDKRVCNGEDPSNCLRCFFQFIPECVAKLALKIGQTPLRKFSGRINSLNSLKRRVNIMVDCVNAAEIVLPATQFLADILIRHGINGSRIKVVPYGIDIGPLPEKASIPAKFSEMTPLRLGFIGTLSETKGPHVILDALSLLGVKARKVVLDIYGKIDQADLFCRMLQKKAKKLDAIVQFKGIFPHEKIGEILRSLHLLIVPSVWYESTPLVLCSSLGAGTPVLVSRLGGMTEVVKEGVNGFSFPAGDAHALSTIISEIVDNPERLVKIHRNAGVRKRSTSDYVDDIESEYVRVINQEKQRK